jgi:hypothetical protein
MTEWLETFLAECERWAQTIAATSEVGPDGINDACQRAAAELTALAIDDPRGALASESRRQFASPAAADPDRSRAFHLADLTLDRAAEASRWVGGRTGVQTGHENKQRALLGLQGQAVTIAREVVALAQGGYGTGALSRWRVLHEVWIVFTVLRDRDEDLCHRYLQYAVIDELKLQEDYAQAWDTVGGPPPGFSSFERNRRRAAMVMRFGNTFLREYGWAAPLFEGRPPRFRELQTLVQLEPLPGARPGRFPPTPARDGGTHTMDAPPTALIAVGNVTAGLLDYAAAELMAMDRLSQARAQLRRHAVLTIMDRALDAFVAGTRDPAAPVAGTRDPPTSGPGVTPSR